MWLVTAITAVILAGGASRRFADAGQPIDKLSLTRDGSSLLEQVIENSRSHCATLVVVGPNRALPDVTFVQETPAGSGPVAAVAAALPLIDTDLLALVAGDAPRGPVAIPALLHAITQRPDCDGAYVVTDRPQYLCAIYRRGALHAALEHLATSRPVAHASLHDLLDGLDLIAIDDPDSLSRDIDTPDDAHDLGFAEM